MLPGQPSPSTTHAYLTPIVDAYERIAYNGMETAIFPSYFHGKCQRDGVNPPGCPNPDCPVVCGTPGSMVHFYPTLRYIAFNQTREALLSVSAPGSDAYQQVEKEVMKAARQHTRRSSRIYPRAASKAKAKAKGKAKALASSSSATSTSTSASVSASGSQSAAGSRATSVAGYRKPSSESGSPGSGLSSTLAGPNDGKEMLVPVFVRSPDTPDSDIQGGLSSIMQTVSGLLEQACGGNADESLEALPQCSWEQQMKEYILAFP
ncbi:uncharacterized protein FIBRA_05431 [Fibroporia radiculosa]|uniref:Uncharacterized protein n=1 Tax=Fibroporia radiculosa TaxID=599839 RepID=J4G9D8_9APHY|nr:uncharacterized protein FIBRA_05431 [Fibroporia radiculosa]CCM03303.1 predicted protein [Fibroporia radiculosa]